LVLAECRLRASGIARRRTEEEEGAEALFPLRASDDDGGFSMFAPPI
jgi:hypothetical protein